VESNEVKLETDQEGAREGKGKGKGKATEIKNDEAAEHASSPKGPPHVSVAAIVGGMSAQKQRRILDRGVDILVATPGRLWDIMEVVCSYPFLIHVCID
jgi:ATP-dependent RNA helicase DDX24/MAK5